MKKFSLALVAAAMALAISTSAWATTACAVDQTITGGTSGTVCSVGAFTFSFSLVSLGANPDTLFFGAATGEIASNPDNVNLDFQINGIEPEDVNLIYEVTGPAGLTTIDNNFNGTYSIQETACATDPTYGCSGGNLASLYNTTGAEDSASFTSNGTFYIQKDAESQGSAPFSQFNDSVEVSATPEPSSLMLLGTGLLGLAFVAFRKAKASGAVLGM